MSTEGKVPQHFVCTHEQARAYIERENAFVFGSCGCRDRGPGCPRSRHDVCLSFNPEWQVTNPRQATKEETLAFLVEAGKLGLVTRPFRNADDPKKLDGICFCCPECCYYFQNPEGEPCDKGTLSEATDRDACIDCGACVDLCYFGARKMADGQLVVDHDKCYGCGLCVPVCPTECISMK